MSLPPGPNPPCQHHLAASHSPQEPPGGREGQRAAVGRGRPAQPSLPPRLPCQADSPAHQSSGQISILAQPSSIPAVCSPVCKRSCKREGARFLHGGWGCSSPLHEYSVPGPTSPAVTLVSPTHPPPAPLPPYGPGSPQQAAGVHDPTPPPAGPARAEGKKSLLS